MSQTTTNRGRMQGAMPDFAYDTTDGGTNLFNTLMTLWTQFSDHLPSRYFLYTLANTATQTITHTFGLTLANLKVQIVEGGVLRTLSQTSADYVMTGIDGNSFSIQNVSGGSKTFIIMIWCNKFGIGSADIDPSCVFTGAGVNITGDAGLVLNSGASESGSSWKATLTRDTANMLADGTYTLPAATTTLVGTTSAQQLTNKDIQGGAASNTNRVRVAQGTYSTINGLARQAGLVWYATDLQTYFGDNGSVLIPIGSGGGGGGGGMEWVAPDGTGAVEQKEFGQSVFLFPSGDVAAVDTWIKVPNGYVAGNQIKMRVGIYSPDVSGTVLATTNAYLIQKSTPTAVDDVTNLRTSTNTAINLGVAALANAYNEALCDITDGTGKINGVSVAPGDLIRVSLVRGSDTATSELRLIKSSTEVSFS